MNQEALKLQKQIMENSKSINEYFNELHDWEKEVSKKDNIIIKQTINKTTTQKNIIEEKKPEIQISSNKNPSGSTTCSGSGVINKLKRDINSIGDYYKEWDKVAADDELRDVDSGVVINNDLGTMKTEVANMKASAASPNINVVIKNNRLGTGGSYAEEHIEKMKNEANAYFAIGRFNKSIEMNMSVIKFITEEEKKGSRKNLNNLKIAIFNNKGNAYLRLGKFKEALKDFDFVLENDEGNVKALFRRGLCLYNLRRFHSAMKDFLKAKETSSETEKNTIEEFVNNCLNEINSGINNERKKMEVFEISENLKLKNLKVQEINLDEILKNEEDGKMNIRFYLNKDKENVYSGNTTNQQQMKAGNARTENKNAPLTLTKNLPTIKSEDMVKFVYDITSEKLSASSFKYAFRNFKNNEKEKQEYLLKINPAYISKIFVNDLDKEILNELFTCMKGILMREDQT
jgi:tetratricopeptide (TPR) repeat protein